MKSLLKSSVSLLVLLGAMTTLNPSHAGNGGIGGEPDPDKKRKIQSKKSSKKPKKSTKIYPNFQEVAEGKAQETGKKQVVVTPAVIKSWPSEILGPELLTQVLFYPGVGPKMTKNTALVCKEWRELIGKGKNLFRHSLQNPQPNLNFLNTFLVHPSAFALAQKVLAPEFPHQMIYQKFLMDPETQKPLPLVEYNVPQTMDNYATLVQGASTYHPILCHQFIRLDPRDFKTVGLAAYIIEKSPSLQKLLQNALEENSFEFNKFPELIKDEKNHPSIQKHLMALKLLTLSGDLLAKGKMDEFTGVLSNFLQPLCGSVALEKYIKKHPTFLHHPFWSAYAVDTQYTDPDNNAPLSLHHSPLALQCSILCNMMTTRHGLSLDSRQIKLFFDHVLAVSPVLSQNTPIFYNILDELKYSQGGQYRTSPELLMGLEEKYKTVMNTSNCYALWCVAEEYADVKQYGKALQILEEALKKIGDSPFRFLILYDMGRFILESGDREALPKAVEYFNIVAQEFERAQVDVLDTPYVYTIGEGDEKQTITLNDSLYLHDFFELKVALDITNGNFDQAYQCIKQYDLTSNTDLDSKALKVAIQSQLHNIPKKLKKLLAKELTRSSSNYLESPYMRNELNEFQDVYTELLQQHNNKSYKKVMKDNEKRFTQQPSKVENTDFEETDESSEEKLSLPKKKDKKQKKDKR